MVREGHSSSPSMSVVRDVDDDVVDVDAEPVAKRLQITLGRPRRFVLGPRGQLKLEQPGGVLLDPLLNVFFQLELRQQKRRPEVLARATVSVPRLKSASCRRVQSR